MIQTADFVNFDAEFSLSSGMPDSDFSDKYSEGTLSRCNSLERLKLSEGYVEENFRIDRRKLEAMILGCPPDPWDTEVMKIPIDNNGRVKSAVEFFEEIMAATNTIIKYPKYLKVGARNKKDPHVRVIGMPDAVSDAGRMVRYELQPNNKITMKLDVSWTCHSHIIGKGGNTIQPVVKRTGVSIHFPDGNKNSELHKSNQVSINSRGEEVYGLEEARSAIRDLTPLIFTFTLPATAQFISVIDTSVLIVHVQNMYNVQADLQLVNKDTLFGSVKGTEWDSARVKEATHCLLQALCGNLANQMTIHTSLEISPQHHTFVLGRNAEVVRKIMQRTTTKIIFPDSNDPMISPLKRSCVEIFGAIENVHLARQNLIGCLPLVLMFDILPTQSLDQRELSQIMQTLDVYILARSKRIDGRRSVIIKGAERNSSNVYEAWRLVTKNGKPAPKAKIPPNYNFGEATSIYGVAGPCIFSPVICNSYPGMFFNDCETNVNSGSDSSLPDSGNGGSLESFKDNGIPFLNKSPLNDGNTVLAFSDTSSVLDSKESSLYSSGITQDIQSANFYSSPSTETDLETLVPGITSLIDMMPDRRAPGCEKKQGALTDYITKKCLANKLMKMSVLPEPRMPTSSWSGYGFSKSQPAFLINQMKKEEKDNFSHAWPEWSQSISEHTQTVLPNIPDEISYGMYKPTINKSASNYIDSVLLKPLNQKIDQNMDDVNSILVSLQMEQYIDLFASQDIDFDMFCSLNDTDLKDLGVMVFGHRRKLTMAIKNLYGEKIGCS